MNKEISNSMSIENDPQFDVVVPICKAFKNLLENGTCKVCDERPREYKWAEKYNCPKRNIDKSNINYKYIKDNL